VGFGLGIERLLLLLDAVGLAPAPQGPDAYAIVPDAADAPRVLPVLDALRAEGVSVLMHAGGGSMKSQFKRADASGARVALIFGADELVQGQVAVKPLRAAPGEPPAAQRLQPLAEVRAWARDLRDA
jgi:histidyl-tRNA synthetase